jgi:hypothetical protein
LDCKKNSYSKTISHSSSDSSWKRQRDVSVLIKSAVKTAGARLNGAARLGTTLIRIYDAKEKGGARQEECPEGGSAKLTSEQTATSPKETIGTLNKISAIAGVTPRWATWQRRQAASS